MSKRNNQNAPGGKRKKTVLDIGDVDPQKIHLIKPEPCKMGKRGTVVYGDDPISGERLIYQYGKMNIPFSASRGSEQFGESKSWKVAVGPRNVTRNPETGEWMIKNRDTGKLENLTGYDLMVYQKKWEINERLKELAKPHTPPNFVFTDIIRPTDKFANGESDVEEQLMRTKLFAGAEDPETGEVPVITEFVDADNEESNLEEFLKVGYGAKAILVECVASVFFGNKKVCPSVTLNEITVVNPGVAKLEMKSHTPINPKLNLDDSEKEKFLAPPKPKKPQEVTIEFPPLVDDEVASA